MWVSLFSLCSSIFLLSGTLFMLSFCSLFILLFDWHCFCCLMCFLVVCYLYCFLRECSLIDHCWCEFCLYVSGFQYVLECHPEGVPLCVYPTDSRGIAQLISVLASHACCSQWSLVLSLLHILCMICCCGYGHSFLLLYHGSTVHHLCVEPLQ